MTLARYTVVGLWSRRTPAADKPTGIGNCWPFGKRDWRASREHSPHAALDANPRELHLHLYRSSVKYHPGYLFSVI
ncbi:unnamed protein product [Leptidea sinapis]|nr:unnamed protein product [Leptidea sinapis]